MSHRDAWRESPGVANIRRIITTPPNAKADDVGRQVAFIGELDLKIASFCENFATTRCDLTRFHLNG